MRLKIKEFIIMFILMLTTLLFPTTVIIAFYKFIGLPILVMLITISFLIALCSVVFELDK